MATELAVELGREPGWMYPWRLGDGVEAPILADTLVPVHQTRLELMRRTVAEQLASAGPEARVLDLACCEGWYSHRLLELGAGSVLGIDVRATNIRRAELVRDHLGVPADRLAFRHTNVFDLDVAELGTYDVVLLLGLIYHVEAPMELLQRARALTRGLCVIESQLTRQERPVVFGDGTPSNLYAAESSFAAVVEEGANDAPLASAPGVMSLVPNRAALAMMVGLAGFSDARFTEPGPHHDRQYRRGDRALVLAR